METSGTSVARLNTLRQHFEAAHSSDCREMSMDTIRCFWLSGLDFRATLTSRRRTRPSDCGTDHGTDYSTQQHPFLSGPTASIIRCKYYLSACGKYTIHCGFPPIQNTQLDRSEVARCTLSVSCSTDLDYCVFVDRVGVVFEHMRGA